MWDFLKVSKKTTKGTKRAGPFRLLGNFPEVLHRFHFARDILIGNGWLRFTVMHLV